MKKMANFNYHALMDKYFPDGVLYSLEEEKKTLEELRNGKLQGIEKFVCLVAHNSISSPPGLPDVWADKFLKQGAEILAEHPDIEIPYTNLSDAKGLYDLIYAVTTAFYEGGLEKIDSIRPKVQKEIRNQLSVIY